MFWRRILAALRPSRCRNARKRPGSFHNRLCRLEPLEARELLTADLPSVLPPISFHPTLMELAPQSGASPTGHGFSPSQIRHAYGLDLVMFGNVVGDGSGQTITIIDAYHSPTITHDLHAFDAAFGLPDPPSFRVVAEDGSTNYPPTDPSGRGSLNWETETALDVEWAHALAPAASLLLVEGTAPTLGDLLQTSVDYARRQPGVSTISMSFGSSEFSGETSIDSLFTTVAGHQGVTFVAASGDSGEPAIYPALSTNVVAIGGTTLSLSANSSYGGESAWSGSGGGVSYYEPLPIWQDGIMSGLWRRGGPDVAFDADPNSGIPVYDSYNFGTASPWIQVGGTSFSSPSWAAILAVANQGRALAGLDSLDGGTQTLPLLYSLNPADFHDVATGNNGLPAGSGYDLATGLGSPVGNLLITDLASATTYGTGGGTTGGGGGSGPTTPVNDDFSAAIVLTGTSATTLGTNVGAGQQAGEPKALTVSGGHSVWWNWTAPSSGTVVVTTQGSDFDTTLGVFSGAALNTLTKIVANDDESLFSGVYTSRVSFTALAGATYHLVVDGYYDSEGNVALALNETVPPPIVVPANDNFAHRIVLTGASVSTIGSNVNATVETGEPKITGERGGHSVWWSWTATATGQVTISTKGSDFDSLLGVYTGAAVNKLKLVAQNDQDGALDTSRLMFRAVKGTTYQIAVDGYQRAMGHIALKISQGISSSVAGPRSAAVSTPNAAAVDRALMDLLWLAAPGRGRR
jgi:hypothetical protein